MKKLFVLSACLVSASIYSVAALAEDCKFGKDFDMELDLSGTEVLAIVARAGTLLVEGDSDLNHAVIKGKACASKEKWLEESNISAREGKQARIEVELPKVDGGWSLTGNSYIYLDLEVTVPADLALDVKDSSGSLDIIGTGSVTLQDSSGSIEIENTGPVTLQDSSGSISLNNINGDVTVISDSSGSIKGENISGSVLVKKDSSGSIHFTDVGGDFTVEKDSSGSITADNIEGNFTVLKDGSGGINSSNIGGEVSIPSD